MGTRKVNEIQSLPLRILFIGRALMHKQVKLQYNGSKCKKKGKNNVFCGYRGKPVLSGRVREKVDFSYVP
jgi:hypothetical protein